MSGVTGPWLSRAGRRLRRTWRRASSPASFVYCLANLLLIVAGSALAREANGVVQDVGSGLLATGIAGLAVFSYVLLQQETAERLRMLGTYGLLTVYGHRSVVIKDEYLTRLQVASRNIDVLGFGLNSLREDQAAHFDEWARRCLVRVLLLDPTAGTGSGSYADTRDLEEGAAATGKIRGEVQAFLTATATLRQTNPNFQVRLYNNIPSINIFRIDNEMFFGPYLLRQPSRNTPTLLIRDGALFDSFLAHFDEIWHDSTLSRAAP